MDNMARAAKCHCDQILRSTVELPSSCLPLLHKVYQNPLNSTSPLPLHFVPALRFVPSPRNIARLPVGPRLPFVPLMPFVPPLRYAPPPGAQGHRERAVLE